MMQKNRKNHPHLIEGEDYYLSPEGYKIFTEKYHLKRGYCCGNGCKHCPYGFHEKFSKKKINSIKQQHLQQCSSPL